MIESKVDGRLSRLHTCPILDQVLFDEGEISPMHHSASRLTCTFTFRSPGPSSAQFTKKRNRTNYVNARMTSLL